MRPTLARRTYTQAELDAEYDEILAHSLTGQRAGRNFSPCAFETASGYYSRNPNSDDLKTIREKIDSIGALTRRQKAHLKRRVRFLFS